MKFIKYIIPIFLALSIISCSDDEGVEGPVNEVEDLLKVQELTNSTHIIELYTESGKLSLGYNNITLRITEKTTGDFVENASITWKPIMHMTAMMHSCPKSDVTKVTNKETIYSGYIVFQMPENDDEGWDLTINYSIEGVEYEVEADISVPKSAKQVVTVFTGSDEVKYILALVEPQNPDVKVNDMITGLYKMENMMSFPIVKNFTVKLDPRMPSMDNHSSPNNEDLTYNASSSMYDGKLSLTMTGYWKLNLMLYNTEAELLKGEEVTDTNESSSLFLELEF
jgi:hypothetical protein